MTIDIIVDANVVVSAQLVQHPNAHPYRIWEALFDTGIQNYVSAHVLAECIDVLQRRDVVRRHRLTRGQVEELVQRFALASLEISSPRSLAVAPDPGDQHLWDMLASNPEMLLITGDPVLLESDHFPGRILSPRQFVERFLDG